MGYVRKVYQNFDLRPFYFFHHIKLGNTILISSKIHVHTDRDTEKRSTSKDLSYTKSIWKDCDLFTLPCIHWWLLASIRKLQQNIYFQNNASDLHLLYNKTQCLRLQNAFKKCLFSWKLLKSRPILETGSVVYIVWKLVTCMRSNKGPKPHQRGHKKIIKNKNKPKTNQKKTKNKPKTNKKPNKNPNKKTKKNPE